MKIYKNLQNIGMYKVQTHCDEKKDHRTDFSFSEMVDEPCYLKNFLATCPKPDNFDL